MTEPPSPSLAPSASPEVTVRAPGPRDGAALYRLVRDVGQLEPNTGYAYVLMADQFGDTCALAEQRRRVVGGVIGFRPPRRPSALFVWQIGVDRHRRGLGIAQRMLDDIFRRNPDLSELLTTVAPSNAASERMFRRFAERHGGRVEQLGGYPADLFPEPHEAERLLCIRDLSPSTQESPC